MRILRQSTANVLFLGPFVDQTDGFTLETALTAAANDVQLYKAENTTPVDISARTWTHVSNGIYRVSLLTTDLDTAGALMIHAHPAGARPVRHDFTVMPAAPYNALVSGTAMPANMVEIASNPSAAVKMTFGALAITTFTVGNGSSRTRVATNLTDAVNDHWNNRIVVFITGTLAGQATSIQDYNGATKEITVAALTSEPASGDLAVIL